MNMNSARILAPVKRGMVDKKVWENGDNDSMRDWTLSRGKVKGVSVVRWTGKGDGVKKKSSNGCEIDNKKTSFKHTKS